MPGVFWTPNAEFVDELAQFLQQQKVLEIFSGNGYLAGLLSNKGITVTATTRFSGHDSHEAGIYHPVEELDAVTAVRAYGDEHDVLLMSWPTVTNSALYAAAEWGGDRDIIFLGEVTDYTKGNLGGCATDAFWEHMNFTGRFTSYRGNMLEAALVGRFVPRN